MRVLSTTISLPADLRKALVHFSLRGLRFILNCRHGIRITFRKRRGKLGTYVLVTFAAAKSEDSGIVTHEGYSLL